VGEKVGKRGGKEERRMREQGQPLRSAFLFSLLIPRKGGGKEEGERVEKRGGEGGEKKKWLWGRSPTFRPTPFLFLSLRKKEE